MNRIRSWIAQWMLLVIGFALALAVSRFSAAAAAALTALILASALLSAAYRSPAFGRALESLQKPVGRTGLGVLILVLAAAPYVLFFDPFDVRPWRAHIAREPRDTYLLFSDDVAYAAGSRTWARTLSNLLVPHNTHIVPAWRVVTWALVCCAGSLERLPAVLAVASYCILVVVMLMTGRLVMRETGKTIHGLAAMMLVGTSSLMAAPATWYSAGQPLWAGCGILATLWYVQSYRRSGRWLALALAAITAPLAGGFWTIGHMAGPTAAVYLWLDGRRRCRLGAIVPLAATVVAVALSLAMTARPIDARISFHGRTAREALNPLQGVLHTAQAIPENLGFANLGLSVETTELQGVFLTLGLLVLWTRRVWQRVLRPDQSGDAQVPGGPGGASGFRLGSLECAGAALVIGSYLVEWSFRGYFDFRWLRTINLRAIVPWYDVIPQLGAVLLVMGWWASRDSESPRGLFQKRSTPATRQGVLGILVLSVCMIVLNRARVDRLVRGTVPALLPSERLRYAIPQLQTMRAGVLIAMQAEWQRANLRRLDRAEEVARRLGLSRDTLHAGLGHPWVSGTVRNMPPELYEHYDAIGLLDLPEHGGNRVSASALVSLHDYFVREPEPRPGWLAPNEPWPPPDENR
jgi:hypothetical protein